MTGAAAWLSLIATAAQRRLEDHFVNVADMKGATARVVEAVGPS
jgi:hypothetical protein